MDLRTEIRQRLRQTADWHAVIDELEREAEAQAQDVDIAGMKPFSQQANYMSLAGYVRFRHFAATGEWMTRQAAEEYVKGKGG